MEPNTQQQPVIVIPKVNKSVIDYVFGALAIGGALYFGNNWWVKHKADKAAEHLDNPASQAASKIYAAKGIFKDDDLAVYEAARFIAQNKVAWKDVAQAFKNLHNENIESFLQSFLSAGELKTFYDIFQYSTGSNTKPPPTAKLQFDTTKEMIVVKATNNANIRKSAKILGTKPRLSRLIDPLNLTKSNVIQMAQAGMVLGYLTGKSFADTNKAETSAVLFYEIGVFSVDGTAQSFKNVWVAASNIDVAKKVAKVNAKIGFDFIKDATQKNKAIIILQSSFDNADA